MIPPDLYVVACSNNSLGLFATYDIEAARKRKRYCLEFADKARIIRVDATTIIETEEEE